MDGENEEDDFENIGVGRVYNSNSDSDISISSAESATLKMLPIPPDRTRVKNCCHLCSSVPHVKPPWHAYQKQRL
eukprot:4469990-Amphidinium_carterae.1